MKKIAKIFSTLFFLGYSPYGPGTVGSIFSFFVLWFFLYPTFISIGAFLGVSILSIWLCDITEKDFGNKDDGRIVLDEFVGSFFSVIFLPKIILYYVLAFIFFRIFDIIKPFFIKKLQNIKGGLGIVIDDVFAGVFANLSVIIIVEIINKF